MRKIDPEWAGVVLRLRAEAKKTLANNTSDGMVIVSMHVVMDGMGKPMVWVVSDGKRVEPSKDAKTTLISMLSK